MNNRRFQFFREKINLNYVKSEYKGVQVETCPWKYSFIKAK